MIATKPLYSQERKEVHSSPLIAPKFSYSPQYFVFTEKEFLLRERGNSTFSLILSAMLDKSDETTTFSHFSRN